MLQVIVTKHVNATRSDINNGYRARTTLTQTVWYHRGVAEQADLLKQALVTYFGDMVSFFDEIAHALLWILARRLNIPDAVMARLMANIENAEFRTVTPHGVVSGGKPKKGV